MNSFRNRRMPAFLLAVCVLIAPSQAEPSPVQGQPTGLECGTPDGSVTAPLPPLQLPIAGVEQRTALMVYVTFPNICNWGECWIPSWLPGLAGENGQEGELEAYWSNMSQGQLDMDITFERLVGTPDTPYEADHPDSYYAALDPAQGPANHAAVNNEILLRVQTNHPGHADYLSQFDYVIMVYNGIPYASAMGGISGLGLPTTFPSEFGGTGYSLRLVYPGFEIDGDANRTHNEHVHAHEFGHVRGAPHSAGSGHAGPCPKRHARYAPMQSHVPHGGEWGLNSYHPQTLIKLGWLTNVVDVTPSGGAVQSFSLADVRSGGTALKVHLAEWSSFDEYLLVTNHQGSFYDADYPGTGLMIWHVRDNLSGGTEDRWDLELPTGLFDAQGQPDTEGGQDLLDLDGRSHATDFWNSGVFGTTTNPTTAVMQPVECPLERASSGVTINNIAPMGSEMDLTVNFAPVPAPVAAVVTPPAETYLGLDCPAAQTLTMPVDILITDPDGTPLPGVLASSLECDLRSTSGPLAFCAGSTAFPSSDTDANGTTSVTYFHACGGGVFEADVSLRGLTIGTSPASKLRTADLNADEVVDIIDLGIWVNPTGPIEDDIRDFNYDLAIDVVDLGIWAGQLYAELSGEVAVDLLTPQEGAVLPIGSTETLSATACAIDGSSPAITYRRAVGYSIWTLGGGSSFDWLVIPPVGASSLSAIGSTPGLTSGSDSVSVTVVPPAIAIADLGNTPPSLPDIGDQGTVRVRLTNNEAVALSQMRGILKFPAGEFTVVSGPTPSNPHALAPGASVDLEWTVERALAGGGATAAVRIKVVGHSEVLVSNSFTVFGGTTGGGS